MIRLGWLYLGMLRQAGGQHSCVGLGHKTLSLESRCRGFGPFWLDRCRPLSFTS